MASSALPKVAEVEARRKLLNLMADTMHASVMVIDFMQLELDAGRPALEVYEEACSKLAAVYQTAAAGLQQPPVQPTAVFYSVLQH